MNTIITAAKIFLILTVLFSGCIEEKIIAPAPGSIQEEAVNISSRNITQSSKEENIPDISITSLSSIYMHDNSYQKDIYLFGWENVPGNESHRLLSLLHDDYGFNWVENAQITKDDVNKTIRVFNIENSIEIMLSNESVTLKRDRSYERYDFRVREENGTHNIYKKKYGTKYDISERYYAVYDLSIKNNGSNPLYFKLNDLRLHEGDRIFNATTLEPKAGSSLMHDLEKENKLQDTTLPPGQSLDGTVAFRINSLYNRSFLLKFNTTTVTSASFEKSIEALAAAEYFNYSVALGVPPYNICRQFEGLGDSYEPLFDDRYDTWANWVNRSIFEAFQKSDLERMRKSPSDNIPSTTIVYALRVFPERNITIFPVKTRFNKSELLVTDDKGEEIIKTSSIEGMAVMNNKTYTFKPQWNLNFPGMNFSNASVVRISFSGLFSGTGRWSINDQDVILDDTLNIVVVRNYPIHMIS